MLAFCWSHVRRGFYDLVKGGTAPIATEALTRIAALYRIEDDIRGLSPAERHASRQARSRLLVSELRTWFEAQLAKLPARSPTADAIRYALNHWGGLVQFLNDGRIEVGVAPGRLWRSSHRERQIGEGIGWPGAGSGRGGGSIGGGAVPGSDPVAAQGVAVALAALP